MTNTRTPKPLTTTERVVAFLRQNPNAKTAEVAEAVGCTTVWVTQIVKRLEAEGRAERSFRKQPQGIVGRAYAVQKLVGKGARQGDRLVARQAKLAALAAQDA